MSDEKPIKHVVVGVWTILRPDTRQYKQQSVEITLDQPIAVEVPAELVYKTVTDPKTGDIIDILTPAGMAYVQQQFEKLYLAPVEDKDGGWDEKPLAAEKVADKAPAPAETKSDDGWEDATDDLPAKSDSKDEDWGEDVFERSEPSNKPDTETDEAWKDDWA